MGSNVTGSASHSFHLPPLPQNRTINYAYSPLSGKDLLLSQPRRVAMLIGFAEYRLFLMNELLRFTGPATSTDSFGCNKSSCFPARINMTRCETSAGQVLLPTVPFALTFLVLAESESRLT